MFSLCLTDWPDVRDSMEERGFFKRKNPSNLAGVFVAWFATLKLPLSKKRLKLQDLKPSLFEALGFAFNYYLRLNKKECSLFVYDSTLGCILNLQYQNYLCRQRNQKQLLLLEHYRSEEQDQ